MLRTSLPCHLVLKNSLIRGRGFCVRFFQRQGHLDARLVARIVVLLSFSTILAGEPRLCLFWAVGCWTSLRRCGFHAPGFWCAAVTAALLAAGARAILEFAFQVLPGRGGAPAECFILPMCATIVGCACSAAMWFFTALPFPQDSKALFSEAAISPVPIAAGSTVSATRFLREHGSAELDNDFGGTRTSNDRSPTGHLDELLLVPKAEAHEDGQEAEAHEDGQEASWPSEARRALSKLRGEAGQLRARLEVAEARTHMLQQQLQTAKAEVESFKQQSLQLSAQIDINQQEISMAAARREAALASARFDSLLARGDDFHLTFGSQGDSVHAGTMDLSSRMESAEVEAKKLWVTAESFQAEARAQLMKTECAEHEASKAHSQLDMAHATTHKLLTELDLANSEAAADRTRAEVAKVELENMIEQQSVDASAQTSKLEQRLRHVEAEASQLRTRQDVADMQKEAAEAKAEAQRACMQVWESEVAASQAQERTAKEELCELHSRAVAAETQLAKFQSLLSATEAEEEKLQSQLDAAKGEARVRLSGVEAELAQVKQQLFVAKAEATSQASQQGTSQVELCKLQALLDVEHGNATRWQREAEDLTNKYAALQQQFNTLEIEHARTHGQAAADRGEKDELEKQLAAMQENSSAEVCQLRLKVQEAHAEITTHVSRSRVVEEELVKLSSSLETAKARNAARRDVESEAANLRSQLYSAEQTLSQCQSKLSNAEGIVVSSHAKVESAEANINRLKETNKKQADVAEVELSSLKETIAALEWETAELRSRLNAAEEDSMAQKSWALAAKQEASAQLSRAEAAEADAVAHKSWAEAAQEMHHAISRSKEEQESRHIECEARNKELHSQLQQQCEASNLAIEDANSRAAALETQLAEKKKAMKLAASRATQRAQSIEAKHLDVLARLTDERASILAELDKTKLRCTELEDRFEQQQMGMLEAVSRVTDESNQKLQANEAINFRLQTELMHQREIAAGERETMASKIEDLELQLTCQQNSLQEVVTRLQDENEKTQHRHDLVVTKLHAQLSNAQESATSELHLASTRSLELQTQLACQQRETQNAIEQERADSLDLLQDKETKNRELQTQLVENAANSERFKLRISELESKLDHQKLYFEDAVTRATSKFEQCAQGLELQNNELASQLIQQRQATAVAVEEALVRSTELESQAASHQQSLCDSEQRDRASESEISALQAELVKLQQAISTAMNAEAAQASELRQVLVSEENAVQAAVAQEKKSRCQQLQESENENMELRATLALQASENAAMRAHEVSTIESKVVAIQDEKSLVDKSLLASELRNKDLQDELAEQFAVAEKTAARIVLGKSELESLEQNLGSMRKEARESQHQLDAYESKNAFLLEQAQHEQQVVVALRNSESCVESRMSDLEAELSQQKCAMRDMVALAKSQTKHRLQSADSKRKDLQLQLDEHRESESQLAQQECELRQLLELARQQGEQELHAHEIRNSALQEELFQQRELLLASERRAEDVEAQLAKQREATAVEATALERVSELASGLAKEKDEENSKMQAQINDLEMMLQISKEFWKSDPNRTLDASELSTFTMQPSPCSEDAWASTRRGRDTRFDSRLGKASKTLATSSSAGSLPPHVLKNLNFNWPGRHLGPDQEGPVKLKLADDDLLWAKRHPRSTLRS